MLYENTKFLKDVNNRRTIAQLFGFFNITVIQWTKPSSYPEYNSANIRPGFQNFDLIIFLLLKKFAVISIL